MLHLVRFDIEFLKMVTLNGKQESINNASHLSSGDPEEKRVISI